ncbi:nuclear polyadenylated RNA-binding protein 3-like [Helianthus annuus]|uniref:nuclear polyadenylated RNA-binding protein 3-like n=1 Tax=Helianthus annuus TaxID=4232 RepID=UPI000B8F3661|nr:nuclear polyadenylated RNA-binding protein 3-like [Helianthus annuus]
MRMKKMENKHGKRRETDSNSDYMSPRLRAIAILKQEIAIMELQDEIALMEYESGRHEDNGDAGEVMTRKEEDDSERDDLACKDVQKLNGKNERSKDRKRRQDDDRDYHEEEEEEESEGFNRNRSPETVSSDVNMKKRMMQKRREQKRKKGYPDLATTVSDKRRRIATENRSATGRFSSTKLPLTTYQRLSATKWVMNNNITVLGITKQIKVVSERCWGR